jgi:cytochrome P450
MKNTSQAVAPARVTGMAALLWAVSFARDPLVTVRRCCEQWGPYVILARALPFYRGPRAVLLDVPLILVTGAALHREILENTATWRPVSLLPGGPKNSAARRMTEGLMRMNGKRHAHYRKLFASPLRRSSVDAMGAAMGRIAEQNVATWQVGERIDLWRYSREVLRGITLELLFGGDDDEHRAIADLITDIAARKWSGSSLALPANLPFTPYRRIVQDSAKLEHRVLAWADALRGTADEHNLAAVVVNSADVDGKPASVATIAGHIPSLYAGATEAGQSTLFWTLLLLAQHPHVARELLDELRRAFGGASPSIAAIADLPRLDAVVKESMRLIPPVPLQMRVAEDDTVLAGHPIPKRSRVLLCTFLTTRLPDRYPEPDRFLPERWKTIDPTPFEYPVFGAGPRICPGYWFGLNAIKISLAAILRQYRIALEPGTRIDYRIQPTMRPVGPLFVVLHRQDEAFAAVPVGGAVNDLVRF